MAVSPDAIADSGAKREIATLLRRMAPIPPSLALAQAAVESAYGTSRFAIAGNALFGQWTTGAGLKPQEQRSAKARFQVAAFGSPLKSVEAYARNLNTHRAYRKFRAARQAQSLNGADPAGLKLISTLRV